MKILVIDDQERNLASAKHVLCGHDVVTISTIQEAFDALYKNADFDAVCTDLFMPLGSFRGAVNTRDYDFPSSDLPAGLVFALKASNLGIRTVICTDADHHSDWVCSLLDLLRGNRGECARVAYVEARMATFPGYWCEDSHKIIECEWKKRENKPLLKDWLRVLKYSGLFTENELNGV